MYDRRRVGRQREVNASGGGGGSVRWARQADNSTRRTVFFWNVIKNKGGVGGNGGGSEWGGWGGWEQQKCQSVINFHFTGR